jgi:hypothetical protein
LSFIHINLVSTSQCNERFPSRPVPFAAEAPQQLLTEPQTTILPLVT